MNALHSPIIEVDRVSFSYDVHTVLRDVSLRVARKDFLAIIGPNGGGKTTLLKLILGLLTPDTGSIRVLSDGPFGSPLRIGYVPQDTSANREFPVTAFDVVRMGRLGFPRRLFGGDAGGERAVRNALELVGMGEYHNWKIGALSGGQRQRVFIARALATEPEALILDEPTANLDPDSQLRVYDLLEHLNDHLTILVVSHDLSALLARARTIAHVNTTLHLHAGPIDTPGVIECLTGLPLHRVSAGAASFKPSVERTGIHED